VVSDPAGYILRGATGSTEGVDEEWLEAPPPRARRDLRSAADSLREASDQLRGRRKRKGRLGRLILLGAVGAGITLAVSETARKAVMDSLFGAEEEFEYTSTTGGNGAGA
jgi:hypothetical protein